MDQDAENPKYADMIPSQRMVLSVFGFLAVVNAYTMRYSLDTALGEIVDRSHRQSNQSAEALTRSFQRLGDNVNLQQIRNATHHFFKRLNVTHFPINLYNESVHGTLPRSMVDTTAADDNAYQWSDQTQTIIMTAFYVGYVLSHIPGGLLAERYGGKWVLWGAIFGTAILTLLTPFTIRHGGAVALILLRLLLGLCEGPTFPALSALLAHWVPPKERGKLGVLALSGGQIGIILVNTMSSVLISVGDWTFMFYFFGGCALVWCMAFVILCYDDPESNPFIDEQEKEYLRKELGNLSRAHNIPTPWKDIFQSPPVWALISSTIQYDWTQANLVNKISAVLRRVHQTNNSVKDDFICGIAVSMPQFLNWIVSLLSGWLSDVLINYEVVSVTDTRRLMASIASIATNFLTNVAACLSSKADYDGFDVVSCALGMMGAYYAGVKVSPLDLSPHYAPTLMAIANGMGSMCGALIPLVDKLAVDNPILKDLRTIIWLICTACMSGEIQYYDQPIAEEHPKSL